MKSSSHHTPRSHRGRHLLTMLGLCLLAATTLPTLAQPAAPPKPPNTTAENKAATTLVNSTPSRYVGDKELDPYIKSVSAVFSISERTTDPFGQLQDPNAKPKVTPQTTKRPPHVVQVQSKPFSEIINLIKVTTVIPIEKRFLIGTRSIREGQIFPINYRSKSTNVQVASVSSKSIVFRNVETGESASLNLDLLPAGMKPGTKGITPLGMKPDSPTAPIELDAGTIPAENSQNR